MGYILCTAEKSSVAKDIADVLGAKIKKNGYYEGNGYRVTWAVGHLVGLAAPEIYGYMSLEDMWDKENPLNKKQALMELPLIPDKFELVVLEKTKKQFYIMKELMNDENCDYIIDCGDAGAEGHILQWFIRVKAGCTKPVKRFMATSMTPQAIKEAMDNLEDADKYIPVIKGEFCKKKADWIMGMSISRAASIIYNAKVDVGRVLSPTLYFVVRRYSDVINFKSKDFYSFQADMNGFSVFWKKDTQNFFKSGIDEEKRLIDKLLAENTAEELEKFKEGKITTFETKNRAADRPQLYDIIELQREGNRFYGYTAEQVLNAAQSLYETHKITSYPRTDSRYITHDLEPLMIERVRDIATHKKYTEECNKLIEHGLNIDEKIMDDSKVTDHHAIIVTEKIRNYDLSLLSEIESRVLNLIITRMLVAFSEKYKYRETIINVTFQNGMIFSASGKVTAYMGWKSVQNNLMGKLTEEDEENGEVKQIFENIELGQNVELKKIKVVKQKTTPSKLFTEDTLLLAMKNAGNNVQGGEILKEKGIGTQSTRGNIIKSLFDKGYVVNQKKGKTNYIVPTKQGFSVIKVLPPELYSPKITADWENQIADIVDGKMNENEFMDNFTQFITEKLKQITGNKIEGVDFTREIEELGKCPWCKGKVVEGLYKDKEGKNFKKVYCTNNKECQFSLFKENLQYKNRAGKELTNSQIKKLLETGSFTKKLKSQSGAEYNAKFTLVKNEKGYPDLQFTFDNSKKRKNKFSGFSGSSFKL